MQNKQLRFVTAFTLIELLISIAIVIMLTMIAMISWRNHINKARDAQRKADLERISVAFEEYFSDNECYPESTILQNCGGTELDPYLSSIPCDPVFHVPYCYIPDTDSPTCYMNYRILAPLGNRTDPIIEKLFCSGDQNCGYDTECANYTTLDNNYNYGVSSFNIPLANPNMPSPSPSPSAQPSQSPSPGNLACWSGICNVTDPENLDQCPITFSDANICQTYCDASSAYWCTGEQ